MNARILKKRSTIAKDFMQKHNINIGAFDVTMKNEYAIAQNPTKYALKNTDLIVWFVGWEIKEHMEEAAYEWLRERLVAGIPKPTTCSDAEWQNIKKRMGVSEGDIERFDQWVKSSCFDDMGYGEEG